MSYYYLLLLSKIMLNKCFLPVFHRFCSIFFYRSCTGFPEKSKKYANFLQFFLSVYQ